MVQEFGLLPMNRADSRHFELTPLTSKNVLNRDFCMEKLLAREVTIFLEKNKSFNILLKIHKTDIKL